nr:hypothetical protein [Tanacetum cinerariifolium]
MCNVRHNEKRQIRVPSKLVDSDYGTLNVKSGRNKNKKDVNSDGVCNEVLDSQNDERVEKMDDCQTGVIRETVEVDKDVNDINQVSEEAERTGMVNEFDNSRDSHKADSQKDNDEGKKYSYAKIVNNNSLDNKLNFIPTEVNDDGTEVMAAGIVSAFSRWKRYDETRQNLAKVTNLDLVAFG